MPSFDVVSRTDLMEVDNAISGAKREIRQRYDLAGSKCDLDRKDDTLTITADDHMKLEHVKALLLKYLTTRKVERGAFVFGNPQEAAGQSLRQVVDIKQGIDDELARKITKAVKSTKFRVQISTKGNELKVSGKKRDDLQEIITFIDSMDNQQPLQYVNFRD